MNAKPDMSIVKNPVGSKPLSPELMRKIPRCLFCWAPKEDMRYMHKGDDYFVVCTACGATGPKTKRSVHAAVESYVKPFKKMREDLADERTHGYNAGRSESYELRCGLRQFAKMIEQLANEPEE